MSARATPAKRVAVQGVGWKKPVTIVAEKYEQVAKSILAVLTADPVSFTELTRRVGKRLPRFDGSIAWYTITVARELEARGRITRHERPVRYARAHGQRATARSARPVSTRAAKPPRRGKDSR